MERLAHAVRPGGHVYIEDLTLREVSSREEFQKMRELLHAVTITEAEDFAQDVDDAGFDEIDMTDMSGSWGAFVAARAKAFTKNRERHVQVHGEEIASRLEHFFSTMEHLFASGVLGGVRIAARRMEPRRS